MGKMSLCKDEQIDKYLEMVRVKWSVRDVIKFDNIVQPSFSLTNYIYLYKKEIIHVSPALQDVVSNFLHAEVFKSGEDLTKKSI